MIRKTLIPFFVLCFVLAAAISTFAAETARFSLSSPMQVAGQKLPAGDYKISWTGTGDNVDVKFTSGKKVSVSVKAKMVETPTANVEFSRSTSGDKITMFYLKGQKQALAFAE